MEKIPSVNFHIIEACNMSCDFCYAKKIGKQLDRDDATMLIRRIAEYGFEKINFAGGEPTLHPELDHFVQEAKKSNMVTSMVTNGYTLIDNDSWLDKMKCLDWIALSIDSDKSEVNEQHGRKTKRGSISKKEYLHMSQSIKQHKIHLKVNTVVTRCNYNDDLSEFIREIGPERWKIMQHLLIRGQNDASQNDLEITSAEFDKFVQRNNSVKQDGIDVVQENNDLMKGSYVMINPEGCFADNTSGTYRYSKPILDVGVESALQEINIDHNKFKERGGYYQWYSR